MSIVAYDVNTFLKADNTLQTIAGKTTGSPMDMYPLIGYGTDDPEYPVPFIVYDWEPSNKGVEQYWNRSDTVRYTIYDSDADRCFKVANRILKLLGEGDSVSQSGGITSNDNRILSSRLMSSASEEPVEKEGWYTVILSFELLYCISA
jgi:hypothetical protein